MCISPLIDSKNETVNNFLFSFRGGGWLADWVEEDLEMYVNTHIDILTCIVYLANFSFTCCHTYNEVATHKVPMNCIYI